MILFKIIFILAAVCQLDALKTKVTQLSPVMDLQQVILADILSRWFYTSYWLRGLCFAWLNETKEKYWQACCFCAGSRPSRVQLWRWRMSPCLGLKRAVKRDQTWRRWNTHITHTDSDVLIHWSCVSDWSSLFYFVHQALQNLKGKTEEIPCVIGNEEVWTKDIRYQLSVS